MNFDRKIKKNGNAIALVFALLPAKSEDCYIKMWNLLIAACRERNLDLQPVCHQVNKTILDVICW
jgi:hypothetical protein